MQHVKEQHLVPQFLLKKFSQDGLKVWSFDKLAIKERWPNTKIRSIVSTPTEKHIYDRIEGDPNKSMEYFLRDIENKASPIIDKLLITKDLNKLNSNDRLIIALFISSQMSRTKGEIKRIEDINSQLNDFTDSHGFRLTPLNIKSFWLNNIEKSDDYVKNLLNKSWSLAICDNEYYISDNPVVKNNTTNIQPHRGTLGLESKGIEIYLPLSSSVLLCLYCAQTFPYKNIVIKASPANIEYFNWLQIISSDRFIYSIKPDFKLILEMIEEDKL